MAGYRQNLSDIYTGITEGKQYTSDKKLSDMYREVINENEDIFRLNTNDPSGYEFIGTVEDNTYRKLITMVRETSKKALDKIMPKSGFVGQYKWMSYFLQEFNIDFEELENWADRKESSNLLGSQLTNPYGEVMLHDIMLPVVRQILVGNPADIETEAMRLYNMLFVRNFDEGKVGVGDGELAISFLSEASKGHPGDLRLPNNDQVELKVGQGRLISARGGGFAKDNVAIREMMGIQEPLTTDHFKHYAGKINNQLVRSAFDVSKNATVIKEYINMVEGPMSSSGIDPVQRGQQLFGVVLNEYGKKHEFRYILCVAQKTRTVQKQPVMHEMTYNNSRYIDVSTYNNIIRATNNNHIIFKSGGEGVYIEYPGGTGGTGMGQWKSKLGLI